jgi:hypothetical protein
MRLVVGGCASLAAVAGLAFGAVPALAAAPEAPTLSVEAPVHASEAILRGVLDPGKEGAAGTFETGVYEFLYSEGTSCEGGSKTAQGLSLGAGQEALPAEALTGLSTDTHYTVCLRFQTGGGEVLSAPSSFTTPTPPEVPLTSSPAQAVTATSAKFEGTLNPTAKAPVEGGAYVFLYNVSASSCEGGLAAPEPAGPAAGSPKEAESVAVTGLQPNAKYTFCLQEHNGAGETATGPDVTFETLAAPPVVESESAPTPRSTEVALDAQVNPNNEATTYSFEYATNEALSGATSLHGAAPLEGFGGQTASVHTGAALNAGTLYFYRVTAENAQSKKEGKPIQGHVEHFTTGPPERPQTSAAEPVAPTSATLKGILNPGQPGNPGTYEFLYRQSPSECQGEGEEATGAQEANGEKSEAVSAEITELLPNTIYSFCLRAHNEAGEESQPSTPLTFTTIAVKPVINGESTTNETATTAQVNAQINPEGSETTYRFEYGTSTAYGSTQPIPDAEIGAGHAAITVSQQLTGLTANTEYHWRITATSPAGTTTSPDQTFNYETEGEALPDGRAYEMVTPPQKNGALIGEALFHLQPDMSEEGSRLILTSIQCFAGAESCTGDRTAEGEQFLFSRTASGWETTALAPPATRFEANTGIKLSAETGMELFGIPTPPMSEDDLYAREPNGEFRDIGPTNSPAEGALGDSEGWATNGILATGDFSRVVYQERNAWPELDQGGGVSVYEYLGRGNAAPVLVGVTGGRGSTSLISGCQTETGNGDNQSNPGVMSTDGEIVYFVASACPSGTGENEGAPVPANEVFARIGADRTAAISEPQALVPEPRPECASAECIKNTERPPPPAVNPSWRTAEFEAASDNGARAFFISGQQLTDGAVQDEGSNLYESECTAGCEGQDERRSLFDASEATAGAKPNGGPRVRSVMAVSSDGSHVYFIAEGVLTATPNARGDTAEEGANNLYVFEHDTGDPHGHLAFIAQLPSADELEFRLQALDESGANVTPDGRYLVFESHANLTSDASRTDGANQIYRYDAETGELLRISIGQNGFNDNGNAGAGDATIVPAGRGWQHAGPARADPTMSHDGRYIFFESPIALTPRALNDVPIGTAGGQPRYAENVYEWHEGRVSLISDGRDVGVGPFGTSAVSLVGSDATGANVFFSTDDPLVKQDTDTQRDYYDAHICSASAPCVREPSSPSPPCLGEECHGTPAAVPPTPNSATATFNGQGNLTPAPPISVSRAKPLTRAQRLAQALRACRTKRNRTRRKRCEVSARRQFGTTAKKSNRGRRQ